MADKSKTMTAFSYVNAMISDEIAVTNKKDGFYANPPFYCNFIV